jgi:hypothetical protein
MTKMFQQNIQQTLLPISTESVEDPFGDCWSALIIYRYLLLSTLETI